jgi:hypothetical protein
MDIYAVVQGILIGNGLLTKCLVEIPPKSAAIKTNDVYSECCVFKADDQLPDGIYELRFLDQLAFVRRLSSSWICGIPWKIGPGPITQMALSGFDRPPNSTQTEENHDVLWHAA